MAIFYDLIVVGETAPRDMVRRMGLHPESFHVKKDVWTGDELGFIVTLYRSTDGYFDCGDWRLKPERFLRVGFRARKERDPVELATNLIALVDRAFETGNEDMALIQLGEILLLERKGHTVRQVPAGFWNNVR